MQEYIKLFQNKNSKELWISWGGAGCQNGNYQFYKTFGLMEVNVLFISFKDNNCWYSNGVPGIGDDIESLMLGISDVVYKFCIDNDIKVVRSIGPSMGGYAAILWTHFIVDRFKKIGVSVKVLALGCETKLFLPGSNSLLHNSKFDFKSNFNEKYIDICDLKYYGDEYILYFGEYFLPDCFSALKFFERQNESIKIILKSITDCPHGIAYFVNQNRGFIRDFFEDYKSGFMPIIHEGSMSKYLTSDDIASMIYPAKTNIEQKYILKSIVSKYWGFGLALNRLGVLYEKEQNWREAYKYLHLSRLVKSNFDNTNAHMDFVIKMIKSKNIKLK